MPANLTNIVAVSAAAAGNYFNQNLALRDDGTVVAWGNYFASQTNVPDGLCDVIGIAAGSDNFLALKNNGTVVSWEGATIFPVPASATNVTAIAVGVNGYNLALTKDGGVISWTNGAASYALPSGLDSNVVAIAAASFCLALKSDGAVVAWGLNNLMQTNVPAGITNLTAVAVDYIHSVGLNSNGTVVSWGHNWGGDGQTNVPAGLSNVVAVAAGGVKGSHNLVLKNDGMVLTWGAGQTNVPSGLSNVVAIAAGDYYNLAIVADLKISAIDFTNKNPAIHFHSFVGKHYSVEYSPDVSSSNWTPLIQTNIQGSGRDMMVSDTNAASASRFYRLKQW